MIGRACARLCALLLGCAICAAGPSGAATLQLDELTWTELRDRVAAGTTTALVPIGGTEQNGPHMVLGKHNVRAQVLATRIAERLGDALVAPVIAYVPEGRISPPTQHMRYPGTLSIPEPVFEATLVAAAGSLRQAGLCQIVFLGDHGGYRASLDRAAQTVNRDRAAQSGCRAHALPEYYRASSTDFAASLKSQGYSAAEIGSHAGLADTALALAADPRLVRADIASARPPDASGDGVAGDPRRARADIGQPGLAHIVDVSVAAIRAARGNRR